MIAFIIIKLTLILYAYLNLKKKLIAIIRKRSIKVKIAGYKKKAFFKLPLVTCIKARCIPQPGQSMPNSCLFKQGNK